MKFFIFSASIQANMFEISTIIIILSVIGSFYYLRFIKILFFEKKIKYDGFIVDNTYNDLVYVLASFSLFVIIFGFIDPSLFLLFSYKIGLGLMFV